MAYEYSLSNFVIEESYCNNLSVCIINGKMVSQNNATILTTLPLYLLTKTIDMSELKLEFIGKQVKDMYGTFMGKVIGIITDTDGSIESVGVDCGSGGLRQLAYEQLLVQGDHVIYIPKWRLDAQKLLRQKNLILQRIKGLQDIVAENDLMKDDAELVYIKYEKRLQSLDETERSVTEKLYTRLDQLDTESKTIKSVLFDAKLQYRSNEITEEIYQQISMQTNELIEHINLEKSEINNIKTKLAQQTLGNIALNTPPNTTSESSIKSSPASPPQQQQEPSTQSISTTPQLISADTTTTETEDKVSITTGKDETEKETSWLNQVLQNE